MKRILLSFFLLISFGLNAQEKTFQIIGHVIGKQKFKYALFYGSSDNFIEKCEIVNDKFTFSGNYSPYTPIGNLSSATVFLVNQFSGENYITVKRTKALYREVMLEPDIDLTFDTDHKITHVKGGPLNDIQNVFFSNHELYSNKRDSAFLAIKNEKLDDAAKTEKIRHINLMLFFEEKARTLYLIKKYPSSEVALFNFMTFAITPVFKDGRARGTFEIFTDSIKQSKYGKRLDGFLADLDLSLIRPSMIDKKFPSFQELSIKGDTLHSKDLLGRYTLIDFWASWCGPCRQENPTIIAAFDKYHKKGFNVVAISIDQLQDKDKWLDAIKKDNTQKFTHLFSPGGKSGIANELKINLIPANYLLDSSGKVIAVDLRGHDLIEKLYELLP